MPPLERKRLQLGGEDSQWTPDLVRDQSYVDPPRTPEEGYHFAEDMADEAIHTIRELRLHQPGRPFMLAVHPRTRPRAPPVRRAPATSANALGLTVAEADDGLAVEQFADGSSLGSTTIDARIPFISTANGTWTTAGYGTPFPVSDEYEPPRRLAPLQRIVIDTGTSSLPGLELLLDDAMRHQ